MVLEVKIQGWKFPQEQLGVTAYVCKALIALRYALIVLFCSKTLAKQLTFYFQNTFQQIRNMKV
jgi:hypothetical protein